MDAEGLSHLRLLQDLKRSRSRFQTLMQRLIAKYNQPFEDDPLVQMATLTYETPQGLRVWGGKLIKERNREQTQDPSRKMIARLHRQSPDGSEHLQPCTQVLGADSESSSAGTSVEEEDLACTLTPTVTGSPWKNDLRRKYLGQVDILLQDAEYFKNAEKRDTKDTLMTWVPSSPVTPAPRCQDSTSAESFGIPEVSASSSRDSAPSYPCPADMAIIPRNDSSLLGTSSNGLSTQSLEDDICNVTVSDLYEGMMHSMSRLLSLKPSCIISTKTYISCNWNLKRRLPRKSGVHMNRTFCHRSKPFRRSSKKGPCSEPGKETRILRDCKNVLHIAPHKTNLKLERDSLEGSKLQVHKFSPAWKELQVTPQKYLDLNKMYYLERENRVKALHWLISPVKVLPRPRMPPSQAEKCYREIGVKFDKLHQECCLSPGKQLRLAGPTESWAVGVYRGGSRSPGSPQGIKTHRLSLPFNRGKAKRSSEAFEDLSEMSVKASRCLPRSDPTPSLSEDSASQSPGQSQQMSSLFLQGHNSGPIRKAVSPSIAISAPWIGPRGCGRNRYDEIKKEFDRLYQKYCLMSPQRVKVTSHVPVPPVKAVPSQTEDLRKLNPDSRFQSSPKLLTSPGWNISPQDSIPVEAHMSAWTTSTIVRDPQFPTKRRKLSYPAMCAHQAESQDSSETQSHALGRKAGRPQVS
ncbi:Holliday junction recognition protein [Onychomys torridus]|uniref:Holliday junction recognition protein n=1 Tax=Onychomys torridus TaxID=38674 RepID=UPI00167F8E3A|nr:Holliday junction recognition protein [Onychomys torridus]